MDRRDSGEMLQVPKTPGKKTPRRMTAAESKDLLTVEKLLFEDDRKTNEFLKTLISAKGLNTAWDDLLKRVQSMEDLCVDVMRKTSHDALAEEFITRGEYVEKVDGEHTSRLKDHQERIELREADSVTQHALNKDHAQHLVDHGERLTVQEKALVVVNEELRRIEAQDLERHEAVLDLHHRAVEQHTKREGELQAELTALQGRVRQEEKLRTALAKEVKSLQDFLYGDALMVHVKKVLREILSEYTLKDELHAEATKAVDIIIKPVLADAHRVKMEIATTNAQNEARFESIEEGLKKANYKIDSDHKDFTLRMETITTSVDLCASKKSVDSKEAALLSGIKNNEAYMKEVKKATGLKFEDLVNRLMEFQSILEDHEHTLQHQAEEILNRTTKYELMLCDRRVDDCALREKVDGEIKELKNMAQWQAMKLEKLGVHQSFGGRRKAVAPQRPGKEPKDGDEDGQRDGTEHSRATSPDHHDSEGLGIHHADFHDIRFMHGLSQTEIFALFRDQLERVAQGVLGLSHLAFHGVALPATTREERQLREAEMIHHLACIVAWISNKKVPPDWDQVKFASLVTSASVPTDFDRRRSPLQSIQRGLFEEASRSTTAASQFASTISSGPAQAGSRSSSVSPRPARRLSGSRRAAGPVALPVDDPDRSPGSQASRAESRKTRPTYQVLNSASKREAPAARCPPPLRAGGAAAGGTSKSPRMGGGFRGHLAKTRVMPPVQGRGDAGADALAGSSTQSEVLPRLVAPLDESLDEGREEDEDSADGGELASPASAEI